MQIGVAQKHMNPMDPNPDGYPDPQHWILKYTRMVLQKPNIDQQYKLIRYMSGHIRPLKDKKGLKYPTWGPLDSGLDQKASAVREIWRQTSWNHPEAQNNGDILRRLWDDAERTRKIKLNSKQMSSKWTFAR